MATILDVDVQGSAAHRNMVEQLTAPFAGGAVDTPVPINSSGVATVAWTSRQSLLVAAPRDTLGDTGLLLATASPAGAESARFFPFTESGAFVILRKPVLDPFGTVAPFNVTLALWEMDADGKAGTKLAQSNIGDRVELSLIEGIFGQLTFILGSEKQRLRRECRVLAAARQLESARRGALDSTGADLGVPRFADALTWDGTEIYAKTTTAPESDEWYRRRLRVYRPWWRPTRANVLRALNGPPPPPAANSGPIAEIPPPLAARFEIDDGYVPLAVAIKIVSAGGASLRTEFLDWVRAVFLVWPSAGATANGVHSKRFVSTDESSRVNSLRQNARSVLDLYGPSAAFAPVLLDALVRASRVRAALGGAAKWKVTQAQDPNHGSRYELGLGALADTMSQNDLLTMAAAVQNPARTPDQDPEIEGVIQAIAARGPASYAIDPEGRWLLEPCGLRTVRQLSSTSLFVSHLPSQALQIDGPDDAPLAGWQEIVALNLEYEGSMRLAFYDRSAGDLEVYSTQHLASAGLSDKKSAVIGKNWTHVVKGQFASGEDSILFYDAAAGTFALYNPRLGASANLTNKLSLQTRPGWTHVVAIRGGFELLFYDAVNGEASYFEGVALGKYKLRWTDTDAPRGLTSLVVSGRGAAAYDRYAGRLTLLTIGAKGLEIDDEIADLPTSWTDVCGTSHQLRFHDPVAHTVTTADLDESGTPTWLDPVALPADATRMVCGEFGEWAGADLVLYDRTTGRGTFVATDSSGGTATALRTITGWRRASGTSYTVSYHESNDAPGAAVLQAALAAAAAAWASRTPGGWTVLTSAQAITALGQAQANDTLRDALRRAALPAPQDPVPTAGKISTALQADPNAAAVLKLDPAFTAEVLAGTGAHDLRALADTLSDERIASAYGFATSGGDVLIVASSADLPDVGAPLAGRNSGGFQWYLIPLSGRRGRITPVGGGVSFTPADQGVSALVAIGYSRQAANRPFEFHVDLPAGATLSLEQYEFLMNVLDHAHPLGVAINTYALRREHVDLDGDGTPEPLPPTISRTFRQFRRSRQLTRR